MNPQYSVSQSQSSMQTSQSPSISESDLRRLAQKLPLELVREIATIAAEQKIDRLIAEATENRTISLKQPGDRGGGCPMLESPRDCFYELLIDSQRDSLFSRVMTKRLSHDRYLNILLTKHAMLAEPYVYESYLRSKPRLSGISVRDIASFKFCREINLFDQADCLPMNAMATLAADVHTILWSNERKAGADFPKFHKKQKFKEQEAFKKAENLMIRGVNLFFKHEEFASLVMPSLRSVTLNDCNIDKVVLNSIAQMIKNNSSIKTIHLGANAVSRKLVGRAFGQPESLQWQQEEKNGKPLGKSATLTLQSDRKLLVTISRRPSQEWAKFDLFD